MFDSVSDTGVVDAITAAARAQNAECARELAAIGELYARRAPEDDADRFNWAVDGHENVVAEAAAALRVSRGRAAARSTTDVLVRQTVGRISSTRTAFRLHESRPVILTAGDAPNCVQLRV